MWAKKLLGVDPTGRKKCAIKIGVYESLDLKAKYGAIFFSQSFLFKKLLFASMFLVFCISLPPRVLGFDMKSDFERVFCTICHFAIIQKVEENDKMGD